jgi:hypothetical protein
MIFKLHYYFKCLYVAYMLTFKDELNVVWLFQMLELEPSISTCEEEFHIPTTKGKDVISHTHIEGQERCGEMFCRELTQILGRHRNIM